MRERCETEINCARVARFETDEIVHSPKRRAVETARIISERLAHAQLSSGAMHAEAMAYDGVVPETLVMLVEA